MAASTFKLHERLEAGFFPITTVQKCRVLMKNEVQFPWFIVVPEVAPEVEDLHQLESERFIEVMSVVRNLSRFVEEKFAVEKLNVACIGNAVRQMHIHVVGRSKTDSAWPGVVWSWADKRKFTPGDEEEILEAALVHFDHQS